MILMFLVVFRSFAKKKEMVRGDKKSNRTTNLDFPSVLLNQGLEANNKKAETSASPPLFFTRRGRKKEEKREEKRGKETVIAEKSSTGDAARQHIPPQNNGENAHYTTRETTRV